MEKNKLDLLNKILECNWDVDKKYKLSKLIKLYHQLNGFDGLYDYILNEKKNDVITTPAVKFIFLFFKCTQFNCK